MAKKTRKKSRKTAGKQHPKRNAWGIKKRLFLGAVFLAVVGLIFMDVHIRAQFEGKRWAIPAKVYARPLELYAGLSLSKNDLKIELQGLGYQFVPQVKQPGQAEFSQHRAIVYTRSFQFTDGNEEAQKLVLEFTGNTVSSLSNFNGKPLAIKRLEPILIGGIYPLNNEDRDLIQLANAPQQLLDALIAVEDRRYYQHHGISFRGISRAMLANIRAGKFIQGGSTLTQQLVKNFYLTSDRSLARKLLEIPMALLLELHYSKDEILETYLNEVYLGQDGQRAIHGFSLGANHFFAKPLQELDLSQLALLAGLVKGPSYYDPRKHPARAKQRRNLVLKVLHEQNYISQQQYEKSTASPLAVVEKGILLKEAYPAYLDYVKRQLRLDYRDEDLNSEGLHIFTSLDPITQAKAETALVQSIAQLEQHYSSRIDELQGSMIVTQPQTGEILAIVGDKHTRYQGFNRALDIRRPIGSLIKPAVYLSALQQGYTLGSQLDDSAIKLTQPNGDIWQPENFDHQSHGQVSLIDALAHSYNQATVRLGMQVGLDNVISTLQQLGLYSELKPYPSLLLGAQALSPVEVATLYQTIAANGFNMKLNAIRHVTDNTGQTLNSYPFQLSQTVSAKEMYLLHHALTEVTHNGTARRIYQSLPQTINTLGKTGTSDQQRDSWFAGFTGNRLAVVWLGDDNNKPLPFTGSGGALQVWTRFMQSQPLLSYDLIPPADVDFIWVDADSGKRSAEQCAGARQLPYIIGTQPTETVDCIYVDNNDKNPVSRSLNWIKDWFH